MAWQLLVVDGADAKRVFALPNPGTYMVGTSHKHCDICLHDLLAARVHCQIDISDDGLIIVADNHPATGTFINKERIDKKVLSYGDILRVGNTHMRLEPAGATPAPPEDETEEEIIVGEIIDEKDGPPPLVSPAMLGHLEGYTLGHYRLEQLVGKSPYKAVFRATDLKTEQEVSVKVLSPQFPASMEELNHFIAVMRRALPLKHDHLVTLYGAGRNGHYTWIAREYVEGKCLTEVLEKLATGVRPKWRSGLRLLQELTHALDFIHRHHLVHGNLTPHNIMIGTDKSAKLANLMFDAALAGSKLLEVARSAKRSHDAAFLAPEQCHDESHLDRLSDLYSLGAVVYARVTGHAPLLGKTPEETMKMIRTKPVPSPRKWNEALPEEFEAILMRLLQKQRQDRYHSATELLVDLEEFAEQAETAE
jgi:serine/threonine protein kinase